MNEKRIPMAPVTLEQATAMLPDGEYIHTFMRAPGMLLGADMSREKILKYFAENGVELSGPLMTAMKHGLVYLDDGKPIFVATREGAAV